MQIFKHTILQLKYYSVKCVLWWHPRPFPANLFVTTTSCNLSLGRIISLIAHTISLCLYCHISTIWHEHVLNAMMVPSELPKRLHFGYLGHPLLLYSIIKINKYYNKHILFFNSAVATYFNLLQKHHQAYTIITKNIDKPTAMYPNTHVWKN